jgi:radical SAM/Cys-rich protein
MDDPRTSADPSEHGPAFQQALNRHGLTLRRSALRVLQVNVGKLCNQACSHCHVDAGPHRTEVMTGETAAEVLDALRRCRPQTLDLTGGAPELNPHFERLVAGARALGCRVIDRCNLTVLTLPGKERLTEFLAAHEVEVVASLPCYLEGNVDSQRGVGVFDASVRALRRLNALGYGSEGTGLVLNLVYNPLGASLPPDQAGLEADYRRELSDRYGIRFNRLYTLANMPIRRFAHQLRREGTYEAYMTLLANAFNPATVDGLMCRDTVSVGWDGRLYDCDFNQMLGLPLRAPCGHVRELGSEPVEGFPIALGDPCFGCTAGAGSSCGGALAEGS